MMNASSRADRRKAYLLSVITGSLGLLVSFSAVGADSNSVNATNTVGPQVSVLRRAAASGDQLPAGFAKLPVVARLQSLSNARLAAVEAGWRYYIAPSTEKDDICLLATSEEGGQLVSAGTCQSLSRIGSTGMYLGQTDTAGRTRVAVVVPDGVTSVHTEQGTVHTVRNNVALIPTMPSPKKLQFVGGQFNGVAITTHFDAPPREAAASK